MENKKDIGKAFREKLNGLERLPKDSVWESISADLNKKKKRVIPLWFKFTSVAVAIILLSLLTQTLWEGTVPDTYIVMPPDAEKVTTREAPAETVPENPGVTPSETSKNKLMENDKVIGTIPNDGASGRISPKNNTVKQGARNQGARKLGISNEGTALKSKNKKSYTGIDGDSRDDGTELNPLVAGDTPKSSIRPRDINSTEPVAEQINDTARVRKTLKRQPLSTKDSTSLPVTPHRQLYVYAHAGPVQHIFPKGKSLIDKTLNNKNTSAVVTFNYGAYIGYNINSRWSVRTGIISTRVEQATRNVSFTYSITQNPENPDEPVMESPKYFSGIDYAGGISNASIIEKTGGQQSATATIIQQTEFIEVPIEVTYRLLGSKTGIGLVGGVSTLHTKKNVVYAENENGSVRMGELKTVNKIGFSLTLGAGFYYEVIPQLQLNAEPVLKYNLNTYNDASPYSLGLQAGLQYTFNLKGK